MEALQINMDDFNKWTQATAVVKVNYHHFNHLQDLDMDPEVLAEARDFVSGWIDKAGADGNGINVEVSYKTVSFYSDGLQRN